MSPRRREGKKMLSYVFDPRKKDGRSVLMLTWMARVITSRGRWDYIVRGDFEARCSIPSCNWRSRNVSYLECPVHEGTITEFRMRSHGAHRKHARHAFN